MRRKVQAAKRELRLETFKVDGTGTAAIGEGQYRATLTDNGSGDYTLTFVEPFARAPVCVASAQAAAGVGDIIAVIAGAPTVSAVRINLFDATDGTTAKDGIFHLIVVGADVVDEQ